MLDLKSFRLQPHSAEIVPPLEVVIPVMVCLSMQRGEEFLCVSWAALQGLLHIVSYYIKRAVKRHYFCNVNFLSLFLYVDVCYSSKPQSEQNSSHGKARPFPPAPVWMPK